MELEGSSWSSGDAKWRLWVPAVDLRMRCCPLTGALAWPPFLGERLAVEGGGKNVGGGGGPITTELVWRCCCTGGCRGGGEVRLEGPGLVDEETTAEALLPFGGKGRLMERRCWMCCTIGRNSGWNWWGLTITSIRGGDVVKSVASNTCSSFINNSGRMSRMTLFCLRCGGGVVVASIALQAADSACCCCGSWAVWTCSSIMTHELSGEAWSLPQLLFVEELLPSGSPPRFMMATTVSLLSATVVSTAIIQLNMVEVVFLNHSESSANASTDAEAM